MPRFQLYVFDAYGTLFDVHSAVGRHRAALGSHADRLSDLWRTKQLEYTWVRSLMGSWRDFQAVTADALDHAAARCGLRLEAEPRAERVVEGEFAVEDLDRDGAPQRQVIAPVHARHAATADRLVDAIASRQYARLS